MCRVICFYVFPCIRCGKKTKGFEITEDGVVAGQLPPVLSTTVVNFSCVPVSSVTFAASFLACDFVSSFAANFILVRDACFMCNVGHDAGVG